MRPSWWSTVTLLVLSCSGRDHHASESSDAGARDSASDDAPDGALGGEDAGGDAETPPDADCATSCQCFSQTDRAGCEDDCACQTESLWAAAYGAAYRACRASCGAFPSDLGDGCNFLCNGARCVTEAEECGSGICVADQTSSYCSLGCASDEDCPSGWACHPDSIDGDLSACFRTLRAYHDVCTGPALDAVTESAQASKTIAACRERFDCTELRCEVLASLNDEVLSSITDCFAADNGCDEAASCVLDREGERCPFWLPHASN